MTALSGSNIGYEIEKGRIKVNPFDSKCIQPASLDLRLGGRYLELIDGAVLDAHKDNAEAFREKSISSSLLLPPGRFILGETLESVSLGAGIIGHLSGRSSVGRLGVLVHVTAGVVDPGWSGKLTLEILNLTQGPVVLYPGDRIAQLTFQYLFSSATNLYDGKYQGAQEPQVSRMYRDIG